LTIYADTSVIASLYAIDRHSPLARSRMAAGPEVWLTSLNRAELASALHLQVFQARASLAQAQLAWANFQQDCVAGVWVPASLPARTWDVCIDLARRHGPTLGVRTLDSLHVACALELRAERFWTFDERQARLAEAVGLDTSG
jgi:predicted nucleic acid-binding protein